MPRRALIDRAWTLWRVASINGGATTASGVLIHVRCDANTAHLSNKAFDVVVLVSTQGFLVGTG